MKPIATVAAIIERDGKILLVKRNFDPFKGKWCLPGGHIEENESAENAVKREIKEETNLDFKGNLFSYVDEIFPEIRWHAVALVFSGQGNGEVKINEESIDYKWIDLDVIDDLELAFNHEKVLKNYKEEK